MPTPKTVRYERLRNLGDYSHEKFAIEAEVLEGETAHQVLERCRLVCDHLARFAAKHEGYAYERYKELLAKPIPTHAEVVKHLTREIYDYDTGDTTTAIPSDEQVDRHFADLALERARAAVFVKAIEDRWATQEPALF